MRSTIYQLAERLSGRLSDGGPWYHETNLDHFIVEPWNAWSSLTFLIPAIAFLWKLRGAYSRHPFITYIAIPLLMLGGTGSTLYHAFRASQAMLLLDFLPIALLTLSVSIYFLYHVTRSAWLTALIVLGSFSLRFLIWGRVDGHAAINLSYAITGTLIFVPALIYLHQTAYLSVRTLTFSIVAFVLALFFRYADELPTPWIPMGTHWLWHVFCAIGAWFLGMYLYTTREDFMAKRLKPANIKG